MFPDVRIPLSLRRERLKHERAVFGWRFSGRLRHCAPAVGQVGRGLHRLVVDPGFEHAHVVVGEHQTGAMTVVDFRGAGFHVQAAGFPELQGGLPARCANRSRGPPRTGSLPGCGIGIARFQSVRSSQDTLQAGAVPLLNQVAGEIRAALGGSNNTAAMGVNASRLRVDLKISTVVETKATRAAGAREVVQTCTIRPGMQSSAPAPRRPRKPCRHFGLRMGANRVSAVTTLNGIEI